MKKELCGDKRRGPRLSFLGIEAILALLRYMSDLEWNGWIVEKNGTIREFYSGEAARVEHRRAEKKQFPW